MRLKCRNCNEEISKEHVKKKKGKSGRGGFIAICPFCGAVNNVKCRSKTGKIKTVKIRGTSPS